MPTIDMRDASVHDECRFDIVLSEDGKRRLRNSRPAMMSHDASTEFEGRTRGWLAVTHRVTITELCCLRYGAFAYAPVLTCDKVDQAKGLRLGLAWLSSCASCRSSTARTLADARHIARLLVQGIEPPSDTIHVPSGRINCAAGRAH